jgi:hypothetical protein
MRGGDCLPPRVGIATRCFTADAIGKFRHRGYFPWPISGSGRGVPLSARPGIHSCKGTGHGSVRADRVAATIGGAGWLRPVDGLSSPRMVRRSHCVPLGDERALSAERDPGNPWRLRRAVHEGPGLPELKDGIVCWRPISSSAGADIFPSDRGPSHPWSTSGGTIKLSLG